MTKVPTNSTQSSTESHDNAEVKISKKKKSAKTRRDWDSYLQMEFKWFSDEFHLLWFLNFKELPSILVAGVPAIILDNCRVLSVKQV
jgi:hypothetical protein